MSELTYQISNDLRADLSIALDACWHTLDLLYGDTLKSSDSEAADKINSVLFLVLNQIKQVHRQVNDAEGVR